MQFVPRINGFDKVSVQQISDDNLRHSIRFIYGREVVINLCAELLEFYFQVFNNLNYSTKQYIERTYNEYLKDRNKISRTLHIYISKPEIETELRRAHLKLKRYNDLRLVIGANDSLKLYIKANILYYRTIGMCNFYMLSTIEDYVYKDGINPKLNFIQILKTFKELIVPKLGKLIKNKDVKDDSETLNVILRLIDHFTNYTCYQIIGFPDNLDS